MKHANKGIHPCFETQGRNHQISQQPGISGPVKKVLCPPKFLKKKERKNWFLLTYSILCSVIFFGEIITVTKNDLATPHIYDCSNSQIAIFVVIYMNSSSLKTVDIC